MMENNSGVMYKVLWVEDEDKFDSSLKIIARKNYHIQLERYDNWDDAEKALRNDFHSYSAIILDAYCRIKNAAILKDTFLSYAKGRIDVICGENRSEKPWYVFSEGTMSDFNRTTTNISEGRNSEWGEMLYIKSDTGSYERMFQTILEVASKQPNNVVLFRHRDVFSYLGNERLIDDRARKIMLKVLSALYYPEENIGFEYQGNPLRKVIEYMFRAARKQGLLTNYCFDENDHINLTNSSKYMSGLTIECYGTYNKREVIGKAWWGGKDGIFPSEVSKYVRDILDYTSAESHTFEETDNEPYIIEADRKEEFFGYVMMLCYTIKWFGRYVKHNCNVELNKSMQREEVAKEETPSDYEGKIMTVEEDEYGNYHCGKCLVSKKYAQVGQKVELFEVGENGQKLTKRTYPFYAKNK